MPNPRERLRRRYDALRFQETGTLLLGALREYLAYTPDCGHSLRWRDPEELVRLADGALAGEEPGRLASLYLENTQKLHSRHYLGHQVPPPTPEAALFELLGKVTNQGSAVFEMGPFPNAVEEVCRRRLAAKIGWTEGWGGIATHGGTLANLTAVLAARNRRFPEAWGRGLGDRRPVLLASGDAHYSIQRAAGILGLGADNVRKVPLDARRRMDPRGLRETYDAAVGEGAEPFCVVATVGSTPVGAFDPIPEIAAFTREKGLWLHADGAHGASVLFSPVHRGLAAGIELCDSVTWDAHKMHYVPSLCTFLLYREEAHAYGAFQQDAPYLLDAEAARLQAYDMATRTVECTRGSVAVAFWAAWALYGEAHFADLVEVTFASTRRLHELLSEASDFEPLHEPQANILCFRHRPEGVGDGEPLSRYQMAVRRALVREGKFYITTARLDGEMALRVTVMNPFTDETDFRDLLAEIRNVGARCLAAKSSL